MKDLNSANKHDFAKKMPTKGLKSSAKIHSSRGQVLVEFAMVLPMLVLILLGVIEMSYLMHDQHVVIRMTREGSNLISRSTNISDAAAAMSRMVNPPVDLNGSDSKLIFTVLTKYTGGYNRDRVIVYQRYEVGDLSATSAFTTQGTISSADFGSAPNYVARNPAYDTDLRVTNVPSTLTIDQGEFVYVTEIYSRHTLITPFNKIGIGLPETLYSIAYF